MSNNDDTAIYDAMSAAIDDDAFTMSPTQAQLQQRINNARAERESLFEQVSALWVDYEALRRERAGSQVLKRKKAELNDAMRRLRDSSRLVSALLRWRDA